MLLVHGGGYGVGRVDRGDDAMTHWRKPDDDYFEVFSIEPEISRDPAVSTFRVVWLTITVALFLSAMWIWLAYGL